MAVSISNKEYSDLVARCSYLEILLTQAVNSAEPYTAKVVDDENGNKVSVSVYPDWVEKARAVLNNG